MKDIICQSSSQRLKNGDGVVNLEIAESEQEKMRVYRLRYQVYVEEMGRRLKSADHKNRLVVDEFDKSGFVVYARVGSETIGTIRVNVGTADQFSPDIVRMFCMDVFQIFAVGRKKQKLYFTSKYLVASPYRKSTIASMIVAWSYGFWRDKGEAQFCFAGCNPYMIPLYERLGFRRFAGNVNIPEYGCMVPLVLVLEDEKHLRAVNSPFYRKARKCKNNPAAAEWFAKHFPAVARFINSSLINKDELWLVLQAKLGQSPLLAIPVLAGLTEEEAKDFVRIGVVHHYKKGESVISPGDYCHEMNILLDGILEVSNPNRNNRFDTIYIKPGNLCGRVSLVEKTEHIVQATVLSDAELLIISGMAFEAFSHNHPIIADKVMDNVRAAETMGYKKPEVIGETYITKEDM